MKSYKARERKCWECGAIMLGTAGRRYCNATCRKEAWRKREYQRKARQISTSAIQRGELIRPDICENCNAPDPSGFPLHGHHDDYSKPLELRWLCGGCHKRTHDGTLIKG